MRSANSIQSPVKAGFLCAMRWATDRAKNHPLDTCVLLGFNAVAAFSPWTVMAMVAAGTGCKLVAEALHRRNTKRSGDRASEAEIQALGYVCGVYVAAILSMFSFVAHDSQSRPSCASDAVAIRQVIGKQPSLVFSQEGLRLRECTIRVSGGDNSSEGGVVVRYNVEYPKRNISTGAPITGSRSDSVNLSGYTLELTRR